MSHKKKPHSKMKIEEKKEHHEHHKLTHKEEVKGGKDSHMHKHKKK